MHPAGYPMPRVPLPPFHGGPPSQPYAIPTRGAVHGPVGAVPHVPPPGSRGFGAGRGNTGAPIGSHLPHHQGTQQAIGNIGSNFNFPALENPNSQPSVGGPLSQPGFVNNVCPCPFFFYLFCKFPYSMPIGIVCALSISFLMCQMPVQGPSQSFRDGFSMGGMSQVFVVPLTAICYVCFCCLFVCPLKSFI